MDVATVGKSGSLQNCYTLIDKLQAFVLEQRGTIAVLTDKLNVNSSNSSLPASQNSIADQDKRVATDRKRFSNVPVAKSRHLMLRQPSSCRGRPRHATTPSGGCGR